jgi:hypothetical protein
MVSSRQVAAAFFCFKMQKAARSFFYGKQIESSKLFVRYNFRCFAVTPQATHRWSSIKKTFKCVVLEIHIAYYVEKNNKEK